MTNSDQGALTLAQLGWRPFFQQQLCLEQWEYPVARVIAQYRNRLDLLGEAGERGLDLKADMPEITVGDWLVLSPEGKFDKLLERQSLFRRKAAGSKVGEQLIAANVDTLFIVTSLNEDFNLNRIERYRAWQTKREQHLSSFFPKLISVTIRRFFPARFRRWTHC